MKLISMGLDNTLRAGDETTVTIFRREWMSVRKAGPGNTTYWVSEKRDTEVKSVSLTSKKTPVDIDFTPSEIGYYLVRATSKDERNNQVISGTSFYVYGDGEFGWTRDGGNELNLQMDSEKYRPGDEAVVMIQSPYDNATALITVERETVFEQRVVQVTGSAPTIRIPILDSYMPNVYVNVILMKGRTAYNAFSKHNVDLGKPSFKIGYINLPVSSDQKKLDVTVATRKTEYRPRSDVDVEIEVKDFNGKGVQSEVTVAVVDLGVLNLIGYKTPNPYSSFYGTQPLAVTTSESLLHLIGQTKYADEEMLKKGGGGAGAAFLYRSDFKATAYYVSSVETSPSGKAKVRFTLPDNLTAFRIMAIAHTKDSAFGSGEQKITLNQPLMVKPSLPRFLRVDDRFYAGAVVINTSGTSGTVKVQSKVEGVRLEEEGTKSIFLENGKSREVLFLCSCEKPGSAVFQYSVELNEFKDGVHVEIPVFQTRASESIALYESTLDSTEQRVEKPSAIVPGSGIMEISASSTALSSLSGSLAYLVEYPYPCLEQRLAKILPFILSKELLLKYRITDMTRQEIDGLLVDNLSRIPDYQDSNGGFRYWPGTSEPSVYLTAHTVFSLHKAKEAGYMVDTTVLNRAIEFLKLYLASDKETAWNYPYTEDAELCVRSYTAYVLSLSGDCDEGYVNRLYEHAASMPFLGRAWLLKALYYQKMTPDMLKTIAYGIMRSLSVEASTAHLEEEGYHGLDSIHATNVIATAVCLQSLIEVGLDVPLAERMIGWLLQRRMNGHWLSTHENIHVFSAFLAYLNTYESTRPDFRLSVTINQRELLAAIFNDVSPKTVKSILPLEELGDGKSLRMHLDKVGQGRLYYGVRLTYTPSGKTVYKDNGMSVRRTFEHLDGQKTVDGTFKAGEKYFVTVEIATPRERNFVVLEDPLPAGLEVVSESLTTESEWDRERLRQKRKELGNKSWSGFDYAGYYDDKVILAADRLSSGVHGYTYQVRATTTGEFTYPATHVEEMYSPEVFGNGNEVQIEVK